MEPTVNDIVLRNGLKLQYVEQGDPSAVPVLLLHGYTDSWRSFERVLPHLPASVHAYAVTQRGHGDADRPADGYGPRDFAADLAAFMDALQIRRAVIAGHSMGGVIAQCFAVEHPGRVLGLVLMGSFATFRGNPGATELWEGTVSTLTDPVDPGFVRTFQESTLAQPVPPVFLDTVIRESQKVPAHVWRSALSSFLETDFAAQRGRIEVPTLLVWGDQDAFVSRRDQDALAAAIPGARLTVYPGVGHGLHWEMPARFAADLAAFVDDVALAGSRMR